jgi:hypothetical protein
MSAPPRKSRRISKRKEVIQDTDNSDTHTNVIGNTENRATAQMIKTQIEAVIPDITKFVVAALSAHGFLFPGNNMANVTQTTNTDNIVTCTSTGLNSQLLLGMKTIPMRHHSRSIYLITIMHQLIPVAWKTILLVNIDNCPYQSHVMQIIKKLWLFK